MFKECLWLFLVFSRLKSPQTLKTTRKDTIPQYLKKLIYKKKKMWKFKKLNKSEHAKFIYKKAYKECKEAYKKNYISELDNICKQNNKKVFLTL